MPERRESKMGQRYQQRKSKRANQILNVAITIVAVLIIFLGSSLAFSYFNDSSKDTVVDEEQTGIGESGDGETIEEGNEEGSSDGNDSESNEDATNEDEEGTEDQDEGTEEDSANEDEEGTEDGEMVVPTEQTNPNPNDFSSAGQNWSEMSEAVHLGAGLDEASTTIIRLENGGSTTSARGILLDRNSSMYYDVRIQWEDNVGWRVESVEESATQPSY